MFFLFFASVIATLFAKMLDFSAIPSILTLIGLFYIFHHKNLSNVLKILVFTAILIIFALLMMHKMSGFNNWQSYHIIKLSSNSAEFSMCLNFDKTLIAFAILYSSHKPILNFYQYRKLLCWSRLLWQSHCLYCIILLQFWDILPEAPNLLMQIYSLCG